MTNPEQRTEEDIKNEQEETEKLKNEDIKAAQQFHDFPGIHKLVNHPWDNEKEES